MDLKKLMLMVATTPKEEALERLSGMIREELGENDGEIDLRRARLAEKIGQLRGKQQIYDSIFSSDGKGEIDLREIGRELAGLFRVPDEEEQK